MAWTIVIARTRREASAAARALVAERGALFILSDNETTIKLVDTYGQSGMIECLGANQAHRGLEGARPDTIIIAGNYLDWNLPLGRITNLWAAIWHTQAMRPGTRVAFR